MDPFGRKIDYLRISITDRCNERCFYCMPEGYKGWQQRPNHLSTQEIIQVVRTAAAIGFRKFRLTGGEPLVRQDVIELVQAMVPIPGVECVGLSTNGTRLAPIASALREAGLRTVNISLDTLDPERYRRITGGNLEGVLAGVRAAKAAGFEQIKLNCVLMRGINEADIWPLTLFAAEYDLPLRLIELMPLSRSDVLSSRNFLPVTEVMERLREKDDLIPIPDHALGWGPAKYYKLNHTGARIGFIGAITNQNFCETCNKLRLTADGKLRPCLGQHGEIDLRGVLRAKADDEAVQQILLSAIQQKPLENQFRDQYQSCRPMTAIGG